MMYVSYLLMLFGYFLLLTTLPLLVELLVLTVAALWPTKPILKEQTQEERDLPLLTVLIPAHNEEALIGRSIESVLVSADPSTKVLVVAHNCTDRTGAKAEAAGASVLVLNDPNQSGKGYALSHGFAAALSDPSQAVLVIDADSLVDAALIMEVRRRFQRGARALQCRYEVNNSQDSARTKLMALAFCGINIVRARGRARLGFSAGILGNGFAIHRDVLARIPYGAHSIVEDLEYHLSLVQAGVRVEFIDTAAVRGEMPVTGDNSRTQRARWEGGRLRMLKQWTPKLLVNLIRGRLRHIEPLLDLLALPIASAVILLLFAFCLPFSWLRLYVLAGFAVLVCHITAAAFEGPGFLEGIKALLSAPAYVLWKLWILPETWRRSRADAPWVRTER